MPSFRHVRITPLPPVYLASLLLMGLLITANLPQSWQLRGGVLSLFLLICVGGSMTALAILLIFQSPMAWAARIGLLLLQGVFLFPWATVVASLLPFMLFFGPGTCSKTFTSPSGAQTVTIETACFMDCTNSLYRDHYILQTEVGGFYSTAKLCSPKHQVAVKWSADEQVTSWQIDGESQTINIGKGR